MTASSWKSSSPSASRWWLFGTQTRPPDIAVVPPTRPVFSRTVTRAPASWAERAATRAAPPDPTTTTSLSRVSIASAPLGSSCFGAAILAADMRVRPESGLKLGAIWFMLNPRPGRSRKCSSPTLTPSRRAGAGSLAS